MADSVLLVGAGGFVGQRLLDALVSRGESVIAVSRSPFHAPGGGCVQAHVRALREVGDYAALLERVRAVVHVASASTPGSSAGKPLQELDDNLRPTLALLEALQERPKLPLIYVSSGGTLSHRTDGVSGETAAVYSRSYHGAGKIAAEQFIEAWCRQFGTAAVVLRPSNLYGPGQRERPGFGIVPTAFGKLMRGETLHVWGDGSVQRDYLYVDDFTRLLCSALDTPPVAGCRVFNACSGTSVDLNTLFALIEQITGRSLLRSYDDRRPVDAPNVHLQASRARAAFGWTASVALRDGLERTWHWFNTFLR
jgi:UDP-glucose 4-epimerase